LEGKRGYLKIGITITGSSLARTTPQMHKRVFKFTEAEYPKLKNSGAKAFS